MKESELRNYLTSSANCLPESARIPELPLKTNMSVVVPAYNEDAYIANLLTCLNLQDFNKHFEIIIIDNGSTDNTSSVVRNLSHSTKQPVYMIEEGKKGAGNARKTGVDEVIRRLIERDKGDIAKHYIAFTDADAQPGPRWLSKLYSTLSASGDSLLVSGNYLAAPETDRKIMEKIGIPDYFSSFAHLAGLLDKLVGQTRMRGPNSGLEIECYVLADGFKQPVDLRGNTAPRECFDLAQRISARGVPIVHFDYPVVTSQRRKLFEITTGISSYETADKTTGRFLSPRNPEDELLEEALIKVPKTVWVRYRDKIFSRIVANTLLFPLFCGIRRDLDNQFNVDGWVDLLKDLNRMSFEDLSEKWALKIAKGILKIS